MMLHSPVHLMMAGAIQKPILHFVTLFVTGEIQVAIMNAVILQHLNLFIIYYVKKEGAEVVKVIQRTNIRLQAMLIALISIDLLTAHIVMQQTPIIYMHHSTILDAAITLLLMEMDA